MQKSQESVEILKYIYFIILLWNTGNYKDMKGGICKMEYTLYDSAKSIAAGAAKFALADQGLDVLVSVAGADSLPHVADITATGLIGATGTGFSKLCDLEKKSNWDTFYQVAGGALYTAGKAFFGW